MISLRLIMIGVSFYEKKGIMRKQLKNIGKLLKYLRRISRS